LIFLLVNKAKVYGIKVNVNNLIKKRPNAIPYYDLNNSNGKL